ncbi:MAG: PepSY-associated TM helix domain-containing protein [Pseudomonadota bacterium]
MTAASNGRSPARTLSASSLEAHTWLGLAISAAMYLICLSGALAVFNQEFERWEQPAIAEESAIDAQKAGGALRAFVDRYGVDTEHFHVVFPTSGIPRLVVEDDHRAHFVNQDGSLGSEESSPWSKMLIELHYYLHLPHTLGIILVSACGAMLLALILSGVFAHSRIIKDAFRLRLGGTGAQQRIDLHNRLSVWGLPFHLMISFTGAYYGLVGVLLVVTAQAFYDGDTVAVAETVFTPEPKNLGLMNGEVPDIERAIEYVVKEDSTGKPVFLTIHEPGTPSEFIEIYVQQQGRLIYAENYRFDGAGKFIGTSGYSDGEMGKQIVYSLYRIHFGDFAGLATKWLYFALGMMLTVIAATGVDVWLAKRKRVTALNTLWPAFVWGAPIALTVSAASTILLDSSGAASFWGSLVVVLVVAGRWPAETVAHRLRIALAVALLALLALHTVSNGTHTLSAAAWPVNASLLLTLGALAFWCRPRRRNADLIAATE